MITEMYRFARKRHLLCYFFLKPIEPIVRNCVEYCSRYDAVGGVCGLQVCNELQIREVKCHRVRDLANSRLLSFQTHRYNSQRSLVSNHFVC
jgi:hypothetical protein